MIYKNILSTDLNVSSICLGGGSFCIEEGETFSMGVMDTFYELNGNFIDTANIYGKWLKEKNNLSEIVIGKWMFQNKNRHQMIIATKGGHPKLETMNIFRLSRKEITLDLEESLSALKTDYVDLYWLHRDDETIPVSTIILYMNELVTQGKIRYFGCSNWKVPRILEAMRFAEENNLKTFVGNQMRWSLAVINKAQQDSQDLVSMDQVAFDFHKQTQMAAIPYASQANGFFEKLKNEKEIPLTKAITNSFYSQKNINIFNSLQRISNELSLSITELTLGYLTAQPFTTIPIIGCSSKEQLMKSMKAGDIILPKEIVESLNCIRNQGMSK